MTKIPYHRMEDKVTLDATIVDGSERGSDRKEVGIRGK